MSDFLNVSQQEGQVKKPLEVGQSDLLPQFQTIDFKTQPAHPSFGALNLDAKKRVIQSELGYGLFKFGDLEFELAPTPEEKAEVLALIEQDKTT